MVAPRSESLDDIAARACSELRAVLARVPRATLDAFAGELAAAARIALHGVGREGLMMRALTMRLHHLGLDAHPVGDMTTPPLGAGDLLVASAGPGRFATVEALLDVAEAAGARRVLVTARDDAELASRADLVVCLPARTMAVDGEAESVLPMGSAFEGCQFLFFELLVAALRESLGVSEAAMRERHTNLE